jgi:hypothetical protein
MRKNLFLTVVWMQRQLTQVNVHRTDVNLGHQRVQSWKSGSSKPALSKQPRRRGCVRTK